MTFVEISKFRWARGTIITKTFIQQYQDTSQITYKYTVRESNKVIESDTTHEFHEVVKRILYYKGLRKDRRL